MSASLVLVCGCCSALRLLVNRLADPAVTNGWHARLPIGNASVSAQLQQSLQHVQHSLPSQIYAVHTTKDIVELPPQAARSSRRRASLRSSCWHPSRRQRAPGTRGCQTECRRVLLALHDLANGLSPVHAFRSWSGQGALQQAGRSPVPVKASRHPSHEARPGAPGANLLEHAGLSAS